MNRNTLEQLFTVAQMQSLKKSEEKHTKNEQGGKLSATLRTYIDFQI